MTTTKTELTDRQQYIFELLREHSRLYGPTYRELMAASGISSPNGIACHLRALERKGYVRITPGKARAIEVLR